jgi:malonyl-CoA/methylmalonyl-CoA synthetase
MSGIAPVVLNDFITHMPTHQTVLDVFMARATAAPERVCVRFGADSLDYGELRARVERAAAAYRAHGAQRGDRIALFLDNSPAFLAAYLGIHLAGCTLVPVNTLYRQVELRHILADSGARLCVTDDAHLPELARVRAELPDLSGVLTDRDLATAPSAQALFAAPLASDIAMIGYTSGTTGRSKGAMLLHRNLLANIASVCQAWRWTSSDHLLHSLPLFHVHGLLVGFHGTVYAGASMELHRNFNAETIFVRLCSGEFTQFFGVPTMYVRLLDEQRRRDIRPPHLRLYVSGSAALSADTFAAFERQFGQRIVERYGMTETAMNLTNPIDGERRPGTVGMPFPGQHARIVDVSTRQTLGPDQNGEIEVRGPHVFAGYWQRPDATREAFTDDGWFRTGDIGRMSADGYVTIDGRANELIITGGYNVYPREVEDVIARFPGVREVAVIGLPDAEYGEQIVAAVAADDTDQDALIAFCKDQLASFKKPKRVLFVDALPRNAMQKVQKNLVRELFLH